MSTPDLRPHKVQLLDKLFEILRKLFAHLVQCHEVLSSHELAGFNLPVESILPQSTRELQTRFNLISQYSHEVQALNDFEDIRVVYDTIFEFILPDLNILENTFTEKSRKYSTADLDHLDALSISNHYFFHFFVNYLFPDTQILKVVQYLKASMETVENISKCTEPSPASPSLASIEDEVQDIMEELVFETDVGVIAENIETYSKTLYRAHETNVRQQQLFKLSILKELSFSPKNNEKFELNYENSILRHILNREINSSPQTFDERQQKVLDVMEVLTFHIDILPTISSLIFQFCEIADYKKIHGTPKNRNDTSYDPSVSHYNRIKVYIQRMLAEKISPTIAYCCENGTECLSREYTFKRVCGDLKDFSQILELLFWVDYVPRHSLIYYNDEFHFLDTLVHYTKCLGELVLLTHQVSLLDPYLLRDKYFRTFEIRDADIKDLFFNLHHFEQRFKYELEIARLSRGEPGL